MAIRNIALIFDDQVRKDTTGIYCLRALKHLVPVEHFSPADMARIPSKGIDLYLNIDDGLEYRLPPNLRPCAWWAIDTHLSMEWCLRKAGDFDVVFAAQRDGAEELRRQGCASACWLPLACDPEIHAKQAVAKEFDVSFVGHVFPGPRSELLELIRAVFPNSFCGQAFFGEMARIYSASRLVFNRSVRNDVNMRVFEALACGSMLLTNDLHENGQEELFRSGEHLALYRDPAELLDKIAFYLKHDDEREKIAANGRAEALAKHTYRHRMCRLLEEVGKNEKVSSRPASGKVRAKPVAPASPLQATPVGVPNELSLLFSDSIREILVLGAIPAELEALLQGRKSIFRDMETGLETGALPPSVSGETPSQTGEGHIGQSHAFDAIVALDWSASPAAPWETLRRLGALLRPGGLFVATLPNVRNHDLIRHLLDGNWTYGPQCRAGQRPLRLFTRREIEKTASRAGFRIKMLTPIPTQGLKQWEAQGSPVALNFGALGMTCRSKEDAQELFASTYWMAAEKEETQTRGLTSIVVIVHNELSYTRLCLDSVRHYTDEPIEIIVVDNASADGTSDYLRSQPDVMVISNDANLGFPKAANQGIRAAAGHHVLLLNNDTVVTTGWLKRLLAALHSDGRIGLVGPCSNFVSGPQQISVSYDDVADLDGFAWEWGKRNDGMKQETDRLVGFCLLIRREVFRKIGLLDEQFGVGCFEDDDICLRALRAGFTAVIARDAFVHHFGGRTFLSTGVDFARLMETNRDLFRKKWQGPSSTRPSDLDAPPAAAPKSEISPTTGLALVATSGGLLLKRLSLSLCMIVRNNSSTIEACLESIRPWVDEMIVVDTGSTDDTPAKAAALGAKVHYFPWCDSFAAARNESLRHARGEWVFWMDSDDTIDAENGRQLRELAARPTPPDILGYVAQVHCPGPGGVGSGEVTVVDHVKLFRNLTEARFEGRIHEQILPALRRLGGRIEWTDIFVVHSGYDHSPQGQERKRQRDLHLLHLELEEQPEHPFTLFNLGMTYVDGKNFAKASASLERSLSHSGDAETHVRKVYALLVYCWSQLGRHEEAWQICVKGLQLFPEDVELQFRRGLLLQHAGRLAEAERAYRDLLDQPRARYFASFDQGLHGFKARQNLAIVCGDMGKWQEAEKQWRMVMDEVPAYRQGWRGLADCLIQTKKTESLRALEEELGAMGQDFASERLYVAAHVCCLDADWSQAAGHFRNAVECNGEDTFFLQALCRFLFDHGPPEEAKKALKDLIRREPTDAPAHHNLGSVHLRLREYPAAEQAYRASLEYRPHSAVTYRQLGLALSGSGRTGEAIEAWEQALQLTPQDSEVATWIRNSRQPVRLAAVPG